MTHRTKVRIQPVVDQRMVGRGDYRHVFFINLINESHHPVRVSSIVFRDRDKRGWRRLMPEAFPQDRPIPAVIPARDGYSTWLPKGNLDAAFSGPGGGIRIEAYTSTGRVFKTKWLMSTEDVPGASDVPSELPPAEPPGSTSSAPEPTPKADLPK